MHVFQKFKTLITCFHIIMDELTERLAALRLLKSVEKESRMNPEKIARMESLYDFIRYLLAISIQLKKMYEDNPEEGMKVFGNICVKIGMKLYNLSVEKQKQVITGEADRNRACSEP